MKTNNLKMTDRNLNYDEIAQNIPKWIAEKADEANIPGLIIGVSGGIDSAVVSTLSAMSGKLVKVLELPIHQNNDEISRAKEHIEWLKKRFSNVTSEIIDLTEVYDIMRKLQNKGINEACEYLADVNLRSRLRAAQLYSTANRNNSLVVGTGNKVEDYGIGFFTKYGDGAVDLSPIGEMYKSEVYNLASTINICNSIQNAAPTDGLHPTGATDEDQIGARYDELEWAMIEYDKGKRINDFEGREKEIMEIYSKRHEVNGHKMEMPPTYSVE